MSNEIFIVEELKSPKELNWEISNYLSHGSFGKIFNIKKKGCSTQYIIKIESLNNKTCKAEHYFYNKVRNLNDKVGILDSYKFPAQIIINNILQGSLILEKKAFNLAFFIDYSFNIEKYTKAIESEKENGSKYKVYTDSNFIRVYNDFSTSITRNIFIRKILSALEFLNKIQVIHRDIKPENIVFNEIYQPYLIDFGFCVSVKDNKINVLEKKLVGTLEYMSPDSHVPIRSKRGDLVSFGYCLFKIFEVVNLPWLKEVKRDEQASVETVFTIKKYFHKNLNYFITKASLTDYFNCIYTKSYNSDPDFDKIKACFIEKI